MRSFAEAARDSTSSRRRSTSALRVLMASSAARSSRCNEARSCDCTRTSLSPSFTRSPIRTSTLTTRPSRGANESAVLASIVCTRPVAGWRGSGAPSSTGFVSNASGTCPLLRCTVSPSAVNALGPASAALGPCESAMLAPAVTAAPRSAPSSTRPRGERARGTATVPVMAEETSLSNAGAAASSWFERVISRLRPRRSRPANPSMFRTLRPASPLLGRAARRGCGALGSRR